MNPGEIALARLHQADGQLKNRPVALLSRMPPFGDFLVCGVSTQLHQQVVDFDEKILPADPEFPATGLKAPSLLRLGFLAVLPESALLGRIGSLAPARHQRLLANLCRHLAAEGRPAGQRQAGTDLRAET